MSEHILEIKNLSVSFFGDTGEIKAVKSADFSVQEGEIFGLVGESGSGKSVTTKAILQVGAENCKITGGEILFRGKNLLTLTEKEMRSFRGKNISMVFQDSLSALNPVYTVGSKLVELIRYHEKISKQEARKRALELIRSVGIEDEERCFASYPHELSGGMRQRIMIAMAISCHPVVMIADEPTTALDVTVQAQILRLIRELQKNLKMSIILITHDLGVIAQMCSRMSVMCGGYTIETGTVEQIFDHPLHPYTKALLDSMPRVGSKLEKFLERNVTEDIRENVCPYYSRCKYAEEVCGQCMPQVTEVASGNTVRCFHYRIGEENEEKAD